jgi:hypothetical protein
MKPLFIHKLQLPSPSSLRVRGLSFFGAYRLRKTNEIPLRRSKGLQGTKQSPFANQTTRAFCKIYQKLFTANSEQGDCFVTAFHFIADLVTIGLVKFDFPSEPKLAMTTKCSAYGLNSDYRLLTTFFKG